jgi:hypothetical protein
LAMETSAASSSSRGNTKSFMTIYDQFLYVITYRAGSLW